MFFFGLQSRIIFWFIISGLLIDFMVCSRFLFIFFFGYFWWICLELTYIIISVSFFIFSRIFFWYNFWFSKINLLEFISFLRIFFLMIAYLLLLHYRVIMKYTGLQQIYIQFFLLGYQNTLYLHELLYSTDSLWYLVHNIFEDIIEKN